MAKVETVTSLEGQSSTSTSNVATASSSGTRTEGTSGESTKKTNDTPQEAGDFTGDAYVNMAEHVESENLLNGSDSNEQSSSAEGLAQASNEQQTVSGTDVTTPIERLKEIQNKLDNLYADWADEFARFVIYSAE